MKIRKTMINTNETKVYIYENKKEEYTVVAIPTIEWSTKIHFDEEKEKIIEKLKDSFMKRLNQEEIAALCERIYQWTREM